jgi:hypothetical protein
MKQSFASLGVLLAATFIIAAAVVPFSWWGGTSSDLPSLPSNALVVALSGRYKLVSDYSGNAMVLNNQTAVTNIGFIGRDIDYQSISNWCLAAVGTVSNLANQTGLTIPWIQAVTAKQPTVYTNNWTGLDSAFTSYDGAGDLLVSGSFPITNTFTVSAWFRLRGAQAQDYERVSENTQTIGYFLGLNTLASPGFIWWIKGNIAGGVIGGTPTLNTWTHLTGTFDGTDGVLYIDGVAVGTNAFTAPGALTQPVYIGGYSGGNFDPNSWIDDFLIYYRALSAEEVQTVYTISTNRHPNP